MEKHAGDLIVESALDAVSNVCVGLDPRPELMPPAVIAQASRKSDDPRSQVCHAFSAFNSEILKAISGSCVAVKFQAACYEAYGSAGWEVLEESIAKAKEHKIPVILDAKRGDIGPTAVHYRQGLMTAAPDLSGGSIPGLAVDWMTANPYLGKDSLNALAGNVDEGKGIFILVRTSNVGAADFQDIATENGPLCDVVAREVHQLSKKRVGASGLADIGAVVGATWPREARRLRTLLPNAIFLVPGYGAQGATADDAVAGVTTSGQGIVVSSSRAIIGAWQSSSSQEKEYAKAASVVLGDTNDDIQNALQGV